MPNQSPWHSLGVLIPVPGTPAGLVAYVRLGPDGTVPRDRRGRIKTSRVTLVHDPAITPVAPGTQVDGLSEREQRWATATGKRQWAGILGQFGDRATEVTTLLARAGLVTLDCHVGTHAQLDQIRGWALTPAWEHDRLHRSQQRRTHVTNWAERAATTADDISALDPGLAETLRSTPTWSTTLPVLVHAGQDLLAGLSHDGPRAFNQTHFGDTKERDNVHALLTNAGAAPETLVALGLVRSPYLGLGGPLIVTTSNGDLPLIGLPGPILFRVNTDRPLRARMIQAGATVAVIENQQAAEAACDLFPDVVVAYCAGQPSDVALTVLREVASPASRILLVPDADLGGVRIADRLHGAFSARADVSIVDVGQAPHGPGRPLGPVSIAGLTRLVAGEGPVAEFALACLNRGYRVEQEATVRAALGAALGNG